MEEAHYYKDFPALNKQRIKTAQTSQPLAYLDNAATTQKPTAVYEAIEAYYEECNANPYRGTYRMSILSTKLYECTRLITAEFIGATPEEIIFTRNTTEALNLVAYSYALATLKQNDQIALPVSEHHSNLVVWQHIAKKTGAELVYLIPDKTGRLTSEEIHTKIGRQTKIVTLAYVSNVLGAVNPIESIIKHAHDCGAVVVLDCAQSIAHFAHNMKQLDVDFAAFSGHKMYAPMGIGVLYAKKELLDTMEPLFYGGEMIDVVREHSSTFEQGPKRFEAGTPNVAGAVGLTAAIHYMETVGFETIRSLEQALAEQILKGLEQQETVKVYGNPAYDTDRTGVISFNIEGVNPQDLALLLDDAGIAVRSGTHCAQPLHRRLGIESSCRISPCFYNTPAEIDRFLDCLTTARKTINRKIMAVFP